MPVFADTQREKPIQKDFLFRPAVTQRAQQRPTDRKHFAAGCATTARPRLPAAPVTACLAGLWMYGLPFLRGTVFEDLSSIVFTVLAVVCLACADRVERALIRG
ncbi:hypothetical protein [Pararhizobium antarcticum]|uniref:hypothetical protein n=1 Tax=Pararhizobium antarcticum TaxID=1798805 RepID=UPI001114D1C7|nr:hypothetical protein [Pararhizobium antarcticum]